MWHYKLIPLLPKEMLVSQWRECIAIKRQWEKGTLKHRLVSYVMDYDKKFYHQYTSIVADELLKRHIKFNLNLFEEIRNFTLGDNYIFTIKDNLYYPEHNDKYFKQCYSNLEEKHDRGIISDEEWMPIERLFEEE